MYRILPAFLVLVLLASACRLGRRDAPNPPTGKVDLCLDNDECEYGVCIDVEADGYGSFCTKVCLETDCPEPMLCTTFSDGNRFCAYPGSTRPQGLGGHCASPGECRSGICFDLVGDDRAAYCSQPCTVGGCPAGMTCAGPDGPDARCIYGAPLGHQAVGEVCNDELDCASYLCIELADAPLAPFCSMACREDGGCPANMACLTFEDNRRLCAYPLSSLPVQPVGGDCLYDDDCASFICIDVHDDRHGAFCTGPCRGHLDCPGSMVCQYLAGLGLTCIY